LESPKKRGQVFRYVEFVASVGNAHALVAVAAQPGAEFAQVNDQDGIAIRFWISPFDLRPKYAAGGFGQVTHRAWQDRWLRRRAGYRLYSPLHVLIADHPAPRWFVQIEREPIPTYYSVALN